MKARKIIEICNKLSKSYFAQTNLLSQKTETTKENDYSRRKSEIIITSLKCTTPMNVIVDSSSIM